jgi:hypothetical protein
MLNAYVTRRQDRKAALVVAMPDKGRNVLLKIIGWQVVLQQDAVLHSLMPLLNLALRLRMIGSTKYVRHAFVFQVLSQLTEDIIRTKPRGLHSGLASAISNLACLIMSQMRFQTRPGCDLRPSKLASAHCTYRSYHR